VLAMSLVLIAPLDAGASSGHAPRHMPRLVGLARAQVYAVMKADQLYFQTRGPGSANGTWAAVAVQSPAPGTLVAWHSQATLTTSLRASHAARAVPRLIGLSRAQTFAAMKRAGLYFQTRGSGSSTGRWVVVVRQSPRPGTRVAWHAEVRLSVSTHRPRPVVKSVTAAKRTTTTLRHPTATTTLRRPTTTTTRPVVKSTTTTTNTTVPVSTTTYPGEVTTTTTPTTTTTVRVTTTTVRVTTTTVKQAPVRYRIGVATWYSYFPGRCATWYLPMGTRITVRDLDNGRTIHCVVTDREGAHGNRVVDLNEAQFSQLAPLHVGVIRVKVSW
jgi:beta-lactam-binding protein with PASTA domain